MCLGPGPDASVSQYPTRQFVPSVWVQATYHARVCVTTCYQSSGTLTRTNHIARCAGLSCPRNYAISNLCKRRTLFCRRFHLEWPRIPAWCLKRKASFWNLIPRWSFSFVSISIFFCKEKEDDKSAAFSFQNLRIKMQVLQKDRYHTELNFPSDLPIRRGCCHHHRQKERAQQFHTG